MVGVVAPAPQEAADAAVGGQEAVDPNPMAEAQQVAFADEAVNHMIHHILEPGEGEGGGGGNVEGEVEENNNGEADEEGEGDHLHGDVWDALINDDLRAIGHLYDRRTIKIDEYLE